MPVRLRQPRVPLNGYDLDRHDQDRRRRQSALVAARRGGDESAFAAVVDLHVPSMLRVAQGYVRSREIAEEVVAGDVDCVDQGDRLVREPIFAAHMAFHGADQHRQAPRYARTKRCRRRSDGLHRGTVDPARFRDAGDPYPGTLAARRGAVPVPGHAGGLGARRRVDRAGATRTRQAARTRNAWSVTMRDMLGLDSAEVCELLEISVANQRVFLIEAARRFGRDSRII